MQVVLCNIIEIVHSRTYIQLLLLQRAQSELLLLGSYVSSLLRDLLFPSIASASRPVVVRQEIPKINSRANCAAGTQ